jgi:hypothetical protein
MKAYWETRGIAITLLAALHEYETWSLIFRGERRLKVFDSRVLRRILDLEGRK